MTPTEQKPHLRENDTYSSDERRHNLQRCQSWAYCVLVFTLCLCVGMLSMKVVLHITGVDGSNVMYLATEEPRAVPVPVMLCESLTVKDHSGVSGTTLFLIHKHPLTSKDTVANSCSTLGGGNSSSSCTLAVPYNCECYAVVTAGPVSQNDIVTKPWDEISWSCKLHPYVVLLIFAIAVACLIGVWFTTYCCYARKGKQNRLQKRDYTVEIILCIIY